MISSQTRISKGTDAFKRNMSRPKSKIKIRLNSPKLLNFLRREQASVMTTHRSLQRLSRDQGRPIFNRSSQIGEAALKSNSQSQAGLQSSIKRIQKDLGDL